MEKQLFIKLVANKPVYLLTIILFFCAHILLAQNAQQLLDEGYRNYKDFNNSFEYQSQPITESEVKKMTQKAEIALSLFNKVMNEGQTEQKLAAAYYTTLILSQHGEIAYKFGDYNVASSDFNSCDANISRFNSNIFPLKFRVGGENIQVDYYKFERYKTNHYYYSGLTFFRQKKMKECVDMLQRMFSASNNIAQERQYIAYNCFVFAQALEPTIMSKSNQSYNALKLIETSTTISGHSGYYEKLLFDEKIILKPLDAAGLLIEYGSVTDASSATMSHCAAAAIKLTKTEPLNKTVLNLLELCLKKSLYYESDKPYTYKINSEDFYKLANEYSQTMVGIDKPKAELVGVKAIQSLSEIAEIRGLYGKDKKLEYPEKYKLLMYCANAFKFWGKPDKEARRRELAEECYNNMSRKQRKENGID